jgi:hypothetical protein
VTVTHSPVFCLNTATTKAYDLIMLCFSARSIRARSGIIELCRCMKRNCLAHKTHIFASIYKRHRAMVEHRALSTNEIRELGH